MANARNLPPEAKKHDGANRRAGAEASARLYSLIETAKANGLEPHANLSRVFADLPAAIAAQDDDAIIQLLPWNVAATDA